MHDDQASVSLWLLAWHGRVEEGLAILTELGMGPEDARTALASTPALLARELSPSTAREVSARLEALGGRVEVRGARSQLVAPPRPAKPVSPVSPAPVSPPPVSPTVAPRTAPPVQILIGRVPWVRLALAVLTVAALTGGYGAVRRAWYRSDVSWFFAPTEDRNISRGIQEEARKHVDDPVVARLFRGIANVEPEIEAEAVRAHYRGLQYFSHDELRRFFHATRRVLGAPKGCDPDERSLDVLTEAEQVDAGRLIAKAVALGAHERRRTGGHERAVEEGVRFAYRRLPAHEQSEFLELAAAADARPRNDEALCEWTLALLDAAEAMHPDLQRRFLRAYAYHIAEVKDAL